MHHRRKSVALVFIKGSEKSLPKNKKAAKQQNLIAKGRPLGNHAVADLPAGVTRSAGTRENSPPPKQVDVKVYETDDRFSVVRDQAAAGF